MALDSAKVRKKLEEAGFKNVTVSITKPHEINVEVLKSTVMDLTEADLKEIEGVSASALITAIKKAN